MMYLRVAFGTQRMIAGIFDHFESRALEWFMAVNISWWGYHLTDPAVTWTNKAAWAFMTSITSEESWGYIAIAIGVLRLLALTINGTFQNTIYATISPYVRGITAASGAVIWFLVFLSVSSGLPSGGTIYQLPLILDGWCALHVMRVTGRDRSRRNVRLS